MVDHLPWVEALLRSAKEVEEVDPIDTDSCGVLFSDGSRMIVSVEVID